MPKIEYSGALPAEQLFRLQLELECIGLESGNVLVRVPCPNPDDIARCLVVRQDGAHTIYFRHDLPVRIREELLALPLDLVHAEPALALGILRREAPDTEVSAFTSYLFPPDLSPELYPNAVRLPDTTEIGTPVFAVVADGQTVSACASVRENDKCAEAWVWTEPNFQRRGYGRQVTAMWAHTLQLEGKLPFYSHKSSNVASEAVARSLGLTQFQLVVSFS